MPHENKLAVKAGELRQRIAELEAEKATLRTRREKRPINQRIHLIRSVLRFCEGVSDA